MHEPTLLQRYCAPAPIRASSIQRGIGRMSVLKRKSKVVIFRASPDEYDALAKSCLESGARSISAFVRAAVIERIHLTGGQPISISGDLTSLGKALSELDVLLREVSGKIHRLLGHADGNGKAAQHN